MTIKVDTKDQSYSFICSCGYATTPKFTMEAAGRELDLHMAEKFPRPSERRFCSAVGYTHDDTLSWLCWR